MRIELRDENPFPFFSEPRLIRNRLTLNKRERSLLERAAMLLPSIRDRVEGTFLDEGDGWMVDIALAAYACEDAAKAEYFDLGSQPGAVGVTLPLVIDYNSPDEETR